MKEIEIYFKDLKDDMQETIKKNFTVDRAILENVVPVMVVLQEDLFGWDEV